MSAPAANPAAPGASLHVACLCAAWCRTCEGYAEVFEAAMVQLRQAQPELQARWIDIEDEAELLGDVDIETFPTLVVVQGGQVRFAGPLTPQPETLNRVLRAALGGGPATPQAAEIEAFARRLVRGP